jgi:hypothetical protein
MPKVDEEFRNMRRSERSRRKEREQEKERGGMVRQKSRDERTGRGEGRKGWETGERTEGTEGTEGIHGRCRSKEDKREAAGKGRHYLPLVGRPIGAETAQKGEAAAAGDAEEQEILRHKE